jgi:hypothetical protein
MPLDFPSSLHDTLDDGALLDAQSGTAISVVDRVGLAVAPFEYTQSDWRRVAKHPSNRRIYTDLTQPRTELPAGTPSPRLGDQMPSWARPALASGRLTAAIGHPLGFDSTVPCLAIFD